MANIGHPNRVVIQSADIGSRIDEAVSLLDSGVEVIIEAPQSRQLILKPMPHAKHPFILGLHPGAMVMAADFDDPLPEEFWNGDDA